MKLDLPRRDEGPTEDISVTNLRAIYCSVLEDMAPLHHELGTCSSSQHNSNNYRWKNAGTITVDGSEDEGFDYSYVSDSSKKSWRLNLGHVGGGGATGITGGDWARDGVKRYNTLPKLDRTEHPNITDNVLKVGDLDVDVGSMNGVQLSPERKARPSSVGEDVESHLDGKFTIDGDAETSAVGSEPSENDLQDVDIVHSEADDGGHTKRIDQTERVTITAFESMYGFSPTLAWRLRSAYSPRTPQEEHLLSLASDIFAQRNPNRADGIHRGLETAKNVEAKVCHGLKRLGELLSYCERLKGEKVRRQDEEENVDLESAEAVFSYFQEKNILPMLVDSVLTHPPLLDDTDKIECDASTSPFSGVTWTAATKSVTILTISMILFNTTSLTSMTYLLSNNYLNELIMGLLPLSQFTEEGLEELLPPFVTLIRGLVMRLKSVEGRSCLPLFLCKRPKSNGQSAEQTETYIPLLYAVIQIFISPKGTSLRDVEGCFVRTTAANVLLNLFRTDDTELQTVLVQGSCEDESLTLPSTKLTPPQSTNLSASTYPLTTEQKLLFPHIANSLNAWFHRSVRLAMASLSLETKHGDAEARAEAQIRHKEIAEKQLQELQYWLGFIDDLLSCDVRAWNVRLLEWLLREVFVKTICISWIRSLDATTHHNAETCTAKTAELLKAQAERRVALIFCSQFCGLVEYRPAIRLLSVLLLSGIYPQGWTAEGLPDTDGEAGDFPVTSTLNAIVSAGEGTIPDLTAPNRLRESLVSTLSGDYSFDEAILSSQLLSVILESEIDDAALELLKVLPPSNHLSSSSSSTSPFEDACASFLTKAITGCEHSGSPETRNSAIESVTSFGLVLLERIIRHSWTELGTCLEHQSFIFYFNSSTFFASLGSALENFALKGREHLELDNENARAIIMEEIRMRYAQDKEQEGIFTCNVDRYKPSSSLDNSSILLCGLDLQQQQKHSCRPSNDLQLFDDIDFEKRSDLRAALFLRSIASCSREFHRRFVHSSKTGRTLMIDELLSFNTTEVADELIVAVGQLQTTGKQELGVEIDLRGRKHYLCSLPKRQRKLDIVLDAEGMRFLVTDRTDLVFVVDPAELYVARINERYQNRCKVLTAVKIQSVVACATESDTLHIVCECGDEHKRSFVISGRLSLRFPTAAVALAAKETLDKHIEALHRLSSLDAMHIIDQCIELSNFHSSAQTEEVTTDFL